jgi:hypothetical protein
MWAVPTAAVGIFLALPPPLLHLQLQPEAKHGFVGSIAAIFGNPNQKVLVMHTLLRP